jgi:hypothetical protein
MWAENLAFILVHLSTINGKCGYCLLTFMLRVSGHLVIKSDGGSAVVNIEIIDATECHVALLKTILDCTAIKNLLDREDFSMIYNTMHGVNGPYLVCQEGLCRRTRTDGK